MIKNRIDLNVRIIVFKYNLYGKQTKFFYLFMIFKEMYKNKANSMFIDFVLLVLAFLIIVLFV